MIREFDRVFVSEFIPGIWYELEATSLSTHSSPRLWRKSGEEDWYYSVSIYGNRAYEYPELTKRGYVYPRVRVADLQLAEIAEEALASSYIKRIKNGTVIEGFRL